MGTDPFPTAGRETVDLTGLPDGVVQGIKQLVCALREGRNSGSSPANGSAVPQPEDLSPLVISRPKPTPEELDRLLDELSSGPPGKVLPADFSRADIYDDHD